MARERRRAFQEAFTAMGIEEEYNDDDLIHATVGEDLGLHELVTDDFDLSNTDEDVDLNLETSESDQSSESESESEAFDIHSRAGITFSTEPIPDRRRRRNILTQTQRPLIQPTTALESFILFFPEEISRTVLRYTNRKAESYRNVKKTGVP